MDLSLEVLRGCSGCGYDLNSQNNFFSGISVTCNQFIDFKGFFDILRFVALSVKQRAKEGISDIGFTCNVNDIMSNL